jgi:sugar lactone lactonase YvrE
MTDTLRTIATGRGLIESPRWHEDRLYFSDWTSGEVLAVDDTGRLEVVASVDSLPLCTAWHPDGRLLIVSSRDGTLLARRADGTLSVYADLGRPGWNDIAVDRRGHVYVNRCGFDPMSGEPFRPGFVHLVAPGGEVREVAGDIDFPNGMAVAADDRTLIVADSYRGRLLAFDIAEDGALTGRRIWADLGDAAPDGICVDAENAVWYADVPNRRCVRVAEGGEVLRTVDADRGCFACALGGSTLYITAAEWHGMTRFPPVTPGSGTVLAVDVDVPAADHA